MHSLSNENSKGGLTYSSAVGGVLSASDDVVDHDWNGDQADLEHSPGVSVSHEVSYSH